MLCFCQYSCLLRTFYFGGGLFLVCIAYLMQKKSFSFEFSSFLKMISSMFDFYFVCTSFVGFLVIFQFFARLVFKVKLMRYHSCDCNRKH